MTQNELSMTFRSRNRRGDKKLQKKKKKKRERQEFFFVCELDAETRY